MLLTGYCTFGIVLLCKFWAYVDSAFYYKFLIAYCLLDIYLLNFHMFDLMSFDNISFFFFFHASLNVFWIAKMWAWIHKNVTSKSYVWYFWVFLASIMKIKRMRCYIFILVKFYLSYMFWCWKRLLKKFCMILALFNTYCLYFCFQWCVVTFKNGN